MDYKAGVFSLIGATNTNDSPDFVQGTLQGSDLDLSRMQHGGFSAFQYDHEIEEVGQESEHDKKPTLSDFLKQQSPVDKNRNQARKASGSRAPALKPTGYTYILCNRLVML
uniref:Uncharacterized protein n=1 Tax=Ditylenchus dipsaci TaxID=166011 RepID=A0A915D9Q5_9BILA